MKFLTRHLSPCISYRQQNHKPGRSVHTSIIYRWIGLNVWNGFRGEVASAVTIILDFRSTQIISLVEMYPSIICWWIDLIVWNGFWEQNVSVVPISWISDRHQNYKLDRSACMIWLCQMFSEKKLFVYIYFTYWGIC